MKSFDPILAIETSTRQASVALRVENEVYEARLERERAHASDLVPTLDALFRRAGLTTGVPLPRAGIIVGIGPGSYTGLRVGIATAKGLVRACAMRMRGVPSLEALAYAELPEGTRGTIVLNARASEFYLATYLRTDDDVVPLQEPCVRRAADVRAALADEEHVFADATVAKAAALSPETAARLRTDGVPRAIALLALGARRIIDRGPQEPEQVDALYLRPFTTPTRRT